ncbi:uncharacterized protein LOC125655863 [Ostrea edulis]|uniref:uncharacterized protein LOC125655863 n=1 Tax=Ostrea edulis TaxID=37623 RepID=UPI0024AF78D7|nr:uncharacterized protein LOC125655863 [Ostrea edulis]
MSIKMGSETQTIVWFSTLILFIIGCGVPVHCVRYRYYYSYRSSYYRYSSSSNSSSGGSSVIGGIVVGASLGFFILLLIGVFVYIRICKRKNHHRVIVMPDQPGVSYIDPRPPNFTNGINGSRSSQAGYPPSYNQATRQPNVIGRPREHFSKSFSAKLQSMRALQGKR